MKPYQRILSVLAGLLVILTTAGSMAVSGAYYYVAVDLPAVDTLKSVQLQVPMRIYSRDGRLIGEFGEYRRIPLQLEQIPPIVIEAFLAAEDDRFYDHPGVDYQGLARALLTLAVTGEKRQGGSTITMQVARNYLLSRKKTYQRKIREIFLALRIERELSKPEILTLYLNKIFLGQRAYGVGAAAEVYYGKTVVDLTLAEIATIAGLPRSPSRENPVTSPERARARRAYVLRRMQELGFVEPDAAAEALEAPVATTVHGPKVEIQAPYLAEVIRREMLSRFSEEEVYTAGFSVTTTLDSRLQTAANRAIQQGLLDYDRRHGYRGPAARVDWIGTVASPGEPEAADATAADTVATAATLQTSPWDEVIRDYPQVGGLVPALVDQIDEQEAFLFLQGIGRQRLTWEGMSWARPYIDDDTTGAEPETAAEILTIGDIVYLQWSADDAWRLAQIPEVQGAIVATDPQDGALVAMTGGFDFRASKYNRAVQARRQPGSAFKPFIYSSALENGFTAATIVNDAPLVRRDPVLEDVWAPKNSSGRFYGERRLRDALVYSMNLATVRVMDAMIGRAGIREIVRYIAQFGFPNEALPRDLSLALGSAGVTPVQMAVAYAAFANGGYAVTPYVIQRIEGPNGKAIFEADPKVICEACLEHLIPESAAESPQLIFAGNVDPAALGLTEAEILGDIDPETGETIAAESLEYDFEAYFADRTITKQNAYLITDMMRDVIRRGTGRRANQLERRDLAGKTGTTNDRRDAWFAGFNGDLVAAAWVGFDQERPLGLREEGARTALPVWMYFMDEALNTVNADENRLPEPQGIVTVRINSKNGEPTTTDDPQAMFEKFRSDFLPESAGFESGRNMRLASPDRAAESDADAEDQEDPLF